MSKNIYQNAIDLIGTTPMVRINKISGLAGGNVYAKMESFNPGGSIKDRICLSMIEAAEKAGKIHPGDTIVEPTSGNTGIGLALVAAVKGYKAILVMPESMSTERFGLLSSFGAEVILTPAIDGMKGSIIEAERLLKENPGYFMPDQFSNPANPEVHRKTTGPEIWDSLNGEIAAFVAAVGTGGTITGVGELLKERKKSIKIIAVEPASSPVLSGGSPGPHKIQGIGAGFIPKVLNRGIIDEVIPVTDDEAFETAKLLAKEEGLMVGISSGANVFAAMKVAKRLGAGKNVVTVLPDTGERYISIEKYFRM
ncbi:MAG: cysteine synthase A [Nitrospirae bacterium RBG_16_43_11]|nr:MAG: cysteine synthase A [Nitrospirae bacterium RBG_16_43_11]